MTYTIHNATSADATALPDIYAWYVRNTGITFDYVVPATEEFADPITNTLKDYPFLVLEDEKGIQGYALLHRFVGREAYNHAAGTTVYLEPKARGKGCGRKLYEALEHIALKQNIFTLYACIGVPVEEDKYLTTNSADYHAHMGFTLAGIFEKCGYKFDTWYSMVWMEKHIVERPPHPEPFIPYSELKGK